MSGQTRKLAVIGVGEAYGLTGTWIGDERLAAFRLTGGEPLGAVGPGDSIVLKHLWWALGYRPPMERDLSVSIVELNGMDGSVQVSAITNAKIDDTWYMMVGLSFSDPGCWEVTGTYREQTVSFVVEVLSE